MKRRVAIAESRSFIGEYALSKDRRRPCLVGLILIVAFLSMPARWAKACPFKLNTASITVKGQSVVVELAVTPQARACGLSHRFSLEKDHGMLFVYQRSGMLTYWMKDTLIPLSIAFLDDGGRIINMESMAPNQTEIKYRSVKPAMYALEVNEGWFRQHGIKAEDRVVMDLTAPANGH